MQRGGSSYSIFKWLLSFTYEGSEGLFKFFVQACVVGALVVFGKSVQGEYCGNGFTLWVPQTWTSVVGCWYGGMVKTVPSDFLNPASGGQSTGNDETIVAPSQSQQQYERPSQRQQDQYGPQYQRNGSRP